MDKKEILIMLCEFLGKMLGDATEVVLHNADGVIIWIKNGHITGREEGITEQRTTMNLLQQRAAEEGENFIIGYKSFSRKGTPLKSSTLFIRNDQGEVEYVLCINQDISAFINLQSQLSHIIGDDSYSQSVDTSHDTLDNIIMKMIIQEMENAKPFDMNSKTEKLHFIARLYNRGFFAAKGAVNMVCEMLYIAQPTLYKYLQELKTEDLTI